MPKAAIIPQEPARFQGVITSMPCPIVMSDIRMRTIVRRLPTETTMGPQMPNKTLKVQKADQRIGIARKGAEEDHYLPLILR